jgi:hypothetical protein
METPMSEPPATEPHGEGADPAGSVVDDDVLGPIDYLAVEFPGGRITGEGFALVMDLVRRGLIRVLDMQFVGKAADGTVSRVQLRDVERGGDIDITRWDGAHSGLLDQSDRDAVGAEIEAGSLAGILVYENVWAVPLMVALGRQRSAPGRQRSDRLRRPAHGTRRLRVRLGHPHRRGGAHGSDQDWPEGRGVRQDRAHGP